MPDPIDPSAPDGAPQALGPIGIFDSGVGGLTVVAALKARLPQEAIVYLGDTARVPWGNRSGDVVRRYAKRCAQFLLAERCKMVVVACNTASAFALADLQAQLPVPVLGVIEAGAALAAAHCPEGAIGVLATEGTVASLAYQKALARLAPRARVHALACPLFVPLVEEGLFDHPATRLLAEGYLSALVAQPAQTLVLGCTHYPLLRPLISQILGPDVRIIDSATAVAENVARALAEAELAAPGPGPGAIARGALTLYATDVTPRIRRIAMAFLGEPQVQVTAVDL